MERQLKIPSTFFSVSALTELLVLFGVIFLMLGNVITVISGVKLHYFIFLLISILIFLLNSSAYVNSVKAGYFLLLLISITYFLIHRNVDNPFIYSLVTYIIIPLVFFNRNFKYFNFTLPLKAFEIFTFLNFFGVLLQVLGFDNPLLKVDLVRTEGEIYQRYGSIAGGTLALGFTATISSIYAYYLVIYERQKSLYNYLVLFVSIVTLLLAQSRRFYFLVFIVMAIIYLFDINKNYNLKKAVSIIISSIFIITISFYSAYLLKERVYFFQRAFSIFNFEDDAANIERVAKWAMAINTFIKNIWFGIGIGGTGTIGKNFTEESSLDDLLVAESFYIKIFVECGVFFGLFFLGLLISVLRKSFSDIRSRDKSFAAIIFIFFFLECFMSTSLESPLPSVLFWICMSQLVFFAPTKSTELST